MFGIIFFKGCLVHKHAMVVSSINQGIGMDNMETQPMETAELPSS